MCLSRLVLSLNDFLHMEHSCCPISDSPDPMLGRLPVRPAVRPARELVSRDEKKGKKGTRTPFVPKCTKRMTALFVCCLFRAKFATVTELHDTRVTKPFAEQLHLYYILLREPGIFTPTITTPHKWGTVGSGLTPGSRPDGRTPEIPDLELRFPPVLLYHGRTRVPTDMVGVPTDRA